MIGVAWITVTAADFLGEGLNSAEKTALANLNAATDAVPAILATAIAELRGVIASAGNTMDAAGTIPPSRKPDLLSIIRWRLLCKFPQFKSLQTDVRQQEYKDAMKRLEEISEQTRGIESPVDTEFSAAGNSGNGSALIAMRTTV